MRIPLDPPLELPKIEWPRNVLFAAFRDYVENVMPHLRLHGNMSLYRKLKELKYAVVCYLQDRVFNFTNLLNHVAPCIELMMQMSVI